MAEITKEEIDEFFKEELALLNDDLEEDLLILESEDDEDKDNFKSIKWFLDTKQDFTRDQLQEELGINILPNQLPTFKLFFCNFMDNEDWIGIPVGNNKTSIPPFRWNPHQVTYSTIQGVIKKLLEAKLIDFQKGKASKYQSKRKISLMKATSKFFEWAVNYDIQPIFMNIDTHVRLRDPKQRSRIIPFEDTAYTKHVDKVFKRYCKKLKEWGIAVDGKRLENIHPFMSFAWLPHAKDKKGRALIRHGGRWYGEWNRTKEKTRTQQISFENTRYKELVELDYTSAGSNALYMWETGAFYKENNGDCYHINFSWLYEQTSIGDKGYYGSNARRIIKNAVKIGMNHGWDGLDVAYFNDKIRKDMEWKSKKPHYIFAKYSMERLMLSYMFTHPEIAHWMAKGGQVGRKAMFLESNLVLGVLDKLVKENIPVVTIYDSMVVPKKYEKRTRELMYKKNNLAWLKRLLAKDEQGQLVEPKRNESVFYPFGKPKT